jgi:transposase
MSTSVLYHALNILGYRHRRTEFVGREIIFTLKQDLGTLKCPCCGSRDLIKRGAMERRFRAPCFAFKQIVIKLAVQRVQCLTCGVVRQVKVGFADRNKRFIRQFERHVLELSQHMTIQDIARHLCVSWDVIKDIQKRYLGRKFSKPKLGHLRCIAIDEIALGRGYQFVTVVLELASGAVVFVGEGKNVMAFEPFFKRLNRARANIEAVAIDMSNAYIEAVTRHLPQAVIVFNHFHVIKLYNDKLTSFRRDLYREATDLLKKKVLKGTRWLLVKNPENLEDRRNERQRLAEALALNEPLATTHYMKEDLRQMLKQADKPSAKTFLEDWISRAKTSGIRMLKDVAKTLEFFKRSLLAWYDYPISTVPLEATNNKIKTLQRQAYGFRDREFFILKIYALHLTKYALVG